jgi:polysaccharide export outer membrane protein
MKSVLTLFFIAFMAVMVQGAEKPQEPDYHLQPEDILSITVYEQPDLTTRERITSEGKISFPLLGKVKAVGLTVSGLRDKIQELLGKDYLVNPQVHVFIEKYHVRQISVLGAVKSPGKYDMYTERETTLLEAIAMAGGFSDVASVNHTRIIRIEKGKRRVIQIRVTDITKKGQKEKDVALNPSDIIFVPESFF